MNKVTKLDVDPHQTVYESVYRVEKKKYTSFVIHFFFTFQVYAISIEVGP